METLEKDVEKRINDWLEGDYDEETKNAIRKLIDNKQTEELTDAFYKDLEFGTGGLRGVMGVGSNRINKYTIGAATQGLSNYLKAQFPGDEIKVAIAHDNRNNATEFAQIVADVFSANGIYVYYFDGLRPTPELSYAIRELNCKSGVMLTASHNPREYSGYKVYWDDGGQIISPHDKNIIEEVTGITDISDIQFEANPDRIEKIGEEFDRLFTDRLKQESLNPQIIQEQSDLSIVYSPIHGTGVKIIPMALEKIGFTNIHLVEEQCVTDGNFPTVVYPNPEEKEAMTMALKKAEEVDADLVMATDPDADRVGIAVKNHSGEFVLLDGNQTGVLLFNYVLSQWRQKGLLKGKEYIVKTIVTTYLIDKIARVKGVKCYNVLTGFKYIGALMTELEGEATFIAGAEESYGYLVGDHVRDKDAVVACNMIAEMTAYYKSRGKTLYETLRDIYLEYGLYKEELVALKKTGKKGAEEIAAIMKSYRENPPAVLGGQEVIRIKDYLSSTEKNIRTGEEKAIDLPEANVMQFITEGEHIISARPSGTEPKIKFYISVNTELTNPDDYSRKEAELDELIRAMKEDLL
ncbi:MAG: phospho-sugar mutase [Balneolaceae bacterium]